MQWFTSNFEMIMVLVAGVIILAGFVSKDDANHSTCEDAELGATRTRHGGMDARTQKGMDTRMFAFDWEGGAKHGGLKVGPE